MDVVLAEWRARTLAEYRSAAIASEVLTWLLRLGFSPDLIQAAHKLLGDELDHADMSWEVYQQLGGSDDPLDVAEASLVTPHAFGKPTFERLVHLCLDRYCIRETLSGPLFAAMQGSARQAGPKQAVDRIAGDAKTHTAFGWALLDEALNQDKECVLEVAKAHLPGFLTRVERAWGIVPEDWVEPVGPLEAAYGLMPRTRYKREFYQRVAEDVLPNFDSRNLPGRASWSKRSKAK